MRNQEHRGLYWLLTGTGGIALALVVANIVLFTGNRTRQAEVNERQKFINESIRIGQINNQLIQLVATTAAQTDDPALRDLLAANGVTFRVNVNPSPPEAGPVDSK